MTLANTQKPATSGKEPPQKPKASGSTMTRMRTYMAGVRSEWGKISWPTWPQIWAQTLVVLVLVSIMTVALWGIDSLLRFVVDLLTP